MAEFHVSQATELKTDADSLKQVILKHLHFTFAKDKYTATLRDLFHAVAYTVRDHLFEDWIITQQQYYDADVKRVYYLSLEFLVGQSLQNSLINTGLYENCLKAVHDIGFELPRLFDVENDAGLGNGGLGRLAACFLDSMASLGIPGYGYGIRYDYGIFTQRIIDGVQVEKPDNWLRYGNPWEICRSEYLYPVQFYGKVVTETDQGGHPRTVWNHTDEVMAVAYDTPVPGYENQTVNTMRLWQAKSSRGFNLNYFNHGDYIRAVEDITLNENITKVLYPNDNQFEGKELRLKQEYFLVSATLQDILRRYNKGHIHLDQFPDKVAIQLNDTHPALAIPELMRLLIDREELSWEKAWQLTTDTFSYTNHTLLPEALERWSVELIAKVLPRHLQIIYEINSRWLESVERQYPNDPGKKRALSIIEEGDPKRINMAKLAIVGSHKVNGVSKLHSELLKHQVFPNFSALTPEKFTNKTNGITPRRWLRVCNPGLSHLLNEAIGTRWVHDLSELKKLEPYADDPQFREAFMQVKHANKEALAKIIFGEHEVNADPASLFDVQIKRIHEYKRQLLNGLHVLSLYLRIKENPHANWTPRTVIFGGKAAPGYAMAKLIIQLICRIGYEVNRDPQPHLKVIFLENYRVSLAEKIIPAANLSEQISTAGTEASGTGNMKLSLNGALTIGTYDGANIEILENVGEENFFLFGLRAEEVTQMKEQGYNPREYYNKDPLIKQVLDKVASYGPDYQPILSNLLDQGDPYFLLADFAAYLTAQSAVSKLYPDANEWNRRAIRTVANMGAFSSDRTIEEYASEIWKLT